MSFYASEVGDYKIDLRPFLNAEGNLDAKAVQTKYRELALTIIDHEDNPSKEHKRQFFNFFCDTSGLRGSEVAAYLGVSRAQVSQWRNDAARDISVPAWNQICTFFAEIFEYGEVRNRVFKRNKAKAA